jgi:hypothetical protein
MVAPMIKRRDWFRLRSHVLLAACVFTTIVVTETRVYAELTIVPTFDSSITGDANAAGIEGVINNAIQSYENAFSDPITVNIKFSAMTSGLGSSNTLFANIPYSSYITALTNDNKTSDDMAALAHLPIANNNPVNGSASINVKAANLKAVGFSVDTGGQPDGSIGLNTHITDIGSPGTSGQYSLLATVEHEIDEVLGLGSALPSSPNGTIFPEDLFRYDGSGNRSYTTTSTATAFFSIDGTTKLAQFDNQNDGGDFGDWQSNPLPQGADPQVQDAFATQFSHPTLGVELRALDVIGYDLAPVPEPSRPVALLGLSLMGLTVLGVCRLVGFITR